MAKIEPEMKGEEDPISTNRLAHEVNRALPKDPNDRHPGSYHQTKVSIGGR